MSTIPGTGVQTGEFLLYQSEDEQTRVQVRLADCTLSLTQKCLADLSKVSFATINERLCNIYADSELAADRTIRKFRIVALEATCSKPVAVIAKTRKPVARQTNKKKGLA